MIRALLLTIFSVSIGATEMPELVPEALKPFAPLVGPSWTGHFPGGELRDVHKFEWIYGGRFLRNEHSVTNADGAKVYEGKTIYAWDASTEQIVWWYWNATGGYVTGTVTPTEDGWLAEGENHGPAGQTPRVRGLLRHISSESWEAVQLYDRDGEWVEQWTMRYEPSSTPGAGASSTRKLFVVHFTTGPAWLEGKPFMEQNHAAEHSANLQRLRKEGAIVLGARYGEVGMIVLQADSEESARGMISSDPSIDSGVFEYSLAPFKLFYPGCVGVE